MDDDPVFRALADASRRGLLDRLHAQNGQTLGELCKGLEMTRQAVTKHLSILEEANLVAEEAAASRGSSWPLDCTAWVTAANPCAALTHAGTVFVCPALF